MSELKPCPMTADEAISALEMCQALMLFDPMTGETHELCEENKDNQDLYNACSLAIDALRRAQPAITGETSDGYHTFNELYHHRAVLFSVICNTRPSISWKSRQHHDGTMYDGMFIVGINTPDGPATYHYDVEPYWKMFRVPELPHAPEWDGHTPAQAIERIGKLSAQLENEPLTLEELHKELERLEELALATNGDAEETYTNGYRWGHRNGQIELLRRILNIGRGACESRCRKPERSDG